MSNTNGAAFNPNESDQDRSIREWHENAIRVSEAPEAQTAKDLRRAAAYLSRARASVIRQAQREGRSVHPEVLCGFDAEIAWYDGLAKAIEDDGGDADLRGEVVA